MASRPRRPPSSTLPWCRSPCSTTGSQGCGTAPQQCELGQGTAAHRASGAAGSALPYSSRQHDAATRRRCTTLWWPADPSLRTAARRVCVREQHAQATGHAYRRQASAPRHHRPSNPAPQLPAQFRWNHAPVSASPARRRRSVPAAARLPLVAMRAPSSRRRQRRRYSPCISSLREQGKY